MVSTNAKQSLSSKEHKIFSLIDEGSLEDLQAVIDLDPGPWRIDCADEHGHTPLMQACFKGNYEICEYLIKKGADVNANDHEHSYTTLMFAALSGSPKICQLLLANGVKAYRTNRIGKNAADMASFIGQHECVSVINNYMALDEIRNIIQPPGSNAEPRLPMEFVPILNKLARSYNIHPVKTVLFLVEHPELLKHRKQLLYVLDELFERQMKQKETNEVMAFKLHVIVHTAREVFAFLDAIAKKDEQKVAQKSETELLHKFIKQLLVTEKSYDFMESLEMLLRRAVQKFPFHESVLFQTVVKQLADTPIGKPPYAMNVVRQVILGIRHMGDSKFCSTCGQSKASKRCGNCKMEDYCSQTCQKLHWHSHKRWCAELKQLNEEIERKRIEREAREALENNEVILRCKQPETPEINTNTTVPDSTTTEQPAEAQVNPSVEDQPVKTEDVGVTLDKEQ